MPTDKRRDLKLLFHGDVIWCQSGYSVQLDWLMRRFLKEGFQVAQASKGGLGGHWIDFPLAEGNLRMYPTWQDPHGSDMIFYGARHFGAKLAISMIDIFVIPIEYIQQYKQLGGKYWAYIPIDSSPISPLVLERLSYVDKIITFSKFGQKELEKHGFVSEMIYEGVDINQLKPMNKFEARKKAEIPPDVFLWGMISANKENPPRKSYQEALEAFKLFVTAHPEARLFIGVQQTAPTGFPIREYAAYLKILDKLYFPDQMYMSIMATRDDVNIWLNTFDGLLHPSQTEGFGLTIVESQSVGVPAVVNNCHSMPELIIPGKTGEIAQVKERRWSPMLNYWEVPDPKSVWWAMEKVYRKVRENPQKVAEDCRDHVVQNFNIDTLFKERWLGLIEQAQEEIMGQQILTPSK